MSNRDYYTDRICIVTGANSGIGFALSEELLKRGATVYMLGRDAAKVAAAPRKLSAHGDRARTLVADVTDRVQVQRAIGMTAAEAGTGNPQWAALSWLEHPTQHRIIESLVGLSISNVTGAMLAEGTVVLDRLGARAIE